MLYKFTSTQGIQLGCDRIDLPLLKEDIERQLGLPKQNQRIMHNRKEITDGHPHQYPRTEGVWTIDTCLFVDHEESIASPYHVSQEHMCKQWPSMKEEDLNRLQIELNDLSKGVICRYSLKELEDEDMMNKAKDLLSQVMMVQLFSPTGSTIVENGGCLTFQGQKMYLYELLEDDSGATVTTKTYWQYARSTPEEYHQMKELNAKREADIRQCEKLLHDLPIALANSEKALTSVDETSEDFDLNEMGAMVYEQKRIRREISAQEQQLKTLRSQLPDCVNWTQLPKFSYYPTLTLQFGMNRLSTGDVIQLVRVNDCRKPFGKNCGNQT